MRELILKNITNPAQLEKLYRDNNAMFKKEFNQIYPELKEVSTAKFWNERLNYESEDISWGSRNELLFVIVVTLLAGFVAKIPYFFSLDEETFYPRNLSLIVLPFLTAYFAWKQKLQLHKLIVPAFVFIIAAIYINLLPDNPNSDTLILACIHLPLFLWATLGFTFTGGQTGNLIQRLEYLRYNGELVVMTTVILIAGAIMSGITIGLFQIIDLNIEKFYMQYIAVWGVASAPIVATFLVQTNPQLVNKVSPVIAKVFTPLVLITLTIYLMAVIYTGKDPYNDREFLLIFNMLLIGVMALIFFSVAESSEKGRSKISKFMLIALAFVTIVVNGIALSAIIFRISEWGITPNRIAVLGGNLLILINLLLITYRMFKNLKSGTESGEVENSIASFLPVYAAWTVVVTFVFPVLFEFK